VNQVRIGGTPLAVQVLELSPYVVGEWRGAGVEGAREVVQEAAAELLSRSEPHLVLDFGALSEVSAPVARGLARLIGEAQRLGRDVRLVRCSDALFRRLQRDGVRGAIAHAASLLAATGGMVGEPVKALELHFRSMPELLHRLRRVASVVARQVGLTEGGELQLKTAVTEAAANAIIHGSPEGVRNHVRISFHMDAALLIVDVADQGPGFDPSGVPLPVPAALQEHGYGLQMMRRSMDRVEFYRNDRGMLVRLTKFLAPQQADWAS
jgi:anti-sigma regulatory factor (Ser/Thr protein kinase)/anti-anti-sigma regulatory factor